MNEALVREIVQEMVGESEPAVMGVGLVVMPEDLLNRLMDAVGVTRIESADAYL